LTIGAAYHVEPPTYPPDAPLNKTQFSFASPRLTCCSPAVPWLFSGARILGGWAGGSCDEDNTNMGQEMFGLRRRSRRHSRRDPGDKTDAVNNYNSPPRRRRYPYIGNRASLEFVWASRQKPCLCRVQYTRVMTRRQRTEPTRYARKLRDADLVNTFPWAGNVPVLSSSGAAAHSC